MNIIVTGASRGIGYETVKALSRDSAHTIIAIARDKKKLIELQKYCGKNFPTSKVYPIAFDLSAGDIKKELLPLVKTVVKRIDILINNAATFVNKPFEKISNQELYQVYNTNVFGVFKLVQALVPLMKNENPQTKGINNKIPGRKSHIINISSMGGFQGSTKFPGLSAYSSSKAALAGLTECLAEEFKLNDISVNCLCLGAVQTEMLSEAFPGYKAPVNPEQIARFIAHFALTNHYFMNGRIIPVTLTTP